MDKLVIKTATEDDFSNEVKTRYSRRYETAITARAHHYF